MSHSKESETAPTGALSRLFEQYSDKVLATAVRVTGSRQDAEDVLQTVFLRLATRPPDPEPGGSYFYRAAVNASIDLLRARARAGAVPLDDVEDGLAGAEDATPERRHADREFRRALRLALSDLPGRGAEIFILRYFEGLSHKEIAGVTRLSSAHAAVTLFRARKRLQSKLRQFHTGEAS